MVRAPKRTDRPCGVGVGRRRLHAAVAGLLLSLAVTAHAAAATFIVNSKADGSDGACSAAAGGCTLREAIEAAVAAAGRDTIRFDATVFTPGMHPVRISLASALPVIAD